MLSDFCTLKNTYNKTEIFNIKTHFSSVAATNTPERLWCPDGLVSNIFALYIAKKYKYPNNRLFVKSKA